ncbi:11676_t:CDS:2, partial [Gigaspora rosea]
HQSTNDKAETTNTQLAKAPMTKPKRQHTAHQGTNDKAETTTHSSPRTNTKKERKSKSPFLAKILQKKEMLVQSIEKWKTTKKFTKIQNTKPGEVLIQERKVNPNHQSQRITNTRKKRKSKSPFSAKHKYKKV